MSPLLRALAERRQFPHVGETDVDAFLDGSGDAPSHAILFFAGDPVQHAETNDVAVVFPELVEAFHGRVRGAVVAASAAERLKARFHVSATPCLVVTRGRETIGSIPRIRDWSEYVAMIDVFLKPNAKPLKMSPASQGEGLLRRGALA